MIDQEFIDRHKGQFEFLGTDSRDMTKEELLAVCVYFHSMWEAQVRQHRIDFDVNFGV